MALRSDAVWQCVHVRDSGDMWRRIFGLGSQNAKGVVGAEQLFWIGSFLLRDTRRRRSRKLIARC
jgi:hypothetical protein